MNFIQTTTLAALLAACSQVSLPKTTQEAPPIAEPTSVPTTLATIQPPPPEEVAPSSAPSNAELRPFIAGITAPFFLIEDLYETDPSVGGFIWISRSGTFAVARDVDLSKVEQEHKDWINQRVKVYQEGGMVCETKVTGLSVLAQVHVFNEETKKKNAADIFALAKERGGLSIVARVAPTECQPRFARLASLSQPETLWQQTPSEELSNMAINKLKELSTYKDAQKEYRAYRKSSPGNPAKLEDYASTSQAYTLTGTTRTLSYAYQHSEGACGEFGAFIFAIWEVSDDRSLTLLYEGTDYITPELAVDIDGDGELEFLQENSVWKKDGGDYDEIESVLIPDEEDVCSC